VTKPSAGTIGPRSLTLNLDRNATAAAFNIDPDALADGIDRIATDLRLRRRGVEAKLTIGETPAPPDATLVRTLRDAHRWTISLKDGVPLGNVALASSHHDVHIRTRSQLAFLSPRLQRAIADGTLPEEVTLQHLVSRTLPLEWNDQERLCGRT
jgi:site-specific DNA recombinase